MARKNRRFSTFSLSFLDIMSCGFGAVALIFLIIKHDVDTRADIQTENTNAEVTLLDEEIRIGKEGLVALRNTLSALNQEQAEAQGLARRILEDVNLTQGKLDEFSSRDIEAEIQRLKEEKEKLQTEIEKLKAEDQQRGQDALRYTGDGDRQYLTGLKLGGARILILIDSSASMLDEKLINIIRTRNMDDDVKREAPKWRRATATVKWLAAQLPQQSQYQIYRFNTDVNPVLEGTYGQWLKVSDQKQLELGILNLRKVVPSGGTSLEKTFHAVNGLNPRPDNIILITDGLPTQGMSKPKRNTITGPEREKLFKTAIDILPKGVPINVILAPMEGDPMAAAHFWYLSQVTKGSFISPSKDWP
ncbi:hypothetical protein R50072_22910 [Simiduia litorea]|uniref:VWA domain-containing protein n=1 Tax=Simiduia litorea TaxID=1435348 RepID=UPI0036F31227